MVEDIAIDKDKTIESQTINHNNRQSSHSNPNESQRAAGKQPVGAAAVVVLRCFNPPSCVHDNVITMSRKFGGDRLATAAMRAGERLERNGFSRPFGDFETSQIPNTG